MFSNTTVTKSDRVLLAGYTAVALALGAVTAIAITTTLSNSHDKALKQRCYAEYFATRGDEPRWPPAYSYQAPTDWFSSQFGTTQAAVLCDFIVENDLVKEVHGEPTFFFED